MTWKVCIRLIAGVGGPVKRDIIQPNARWPGYLVLTRRAYNSPRHDFPLLYLPPTPPHPLRTPTMTTAHTAEEIFTVQAKAQLDSEKPQASSVPSTPLALDLDSDRATHLINLLTDGLVSIRDEDGRFLLKRAYFTTPAPDLH